MVHRGVKQRMIFCRLIRKAPFFFSLACPRGTFFLLHEKAFEKGGRNFILAMRLTSKEATARRRLKGSWQYGAIKYSTLAVIVIGACLLFSNLSQLNSRPDIPVLEQGGRSTSRFTFDQSGDNPLDGSCSEYEGVRTRKRGLEISGPFFMVCV